MIRELFAYSLAQSVNNPSFFTEALKHLSSSKEFYLKKLKKKKNKGSFFFHFK